MTSLPYTAELPVYADDDAEAQFDRPALWRYAVAVVTTAAALLCWVGHVAHAQANFLLLDVRFAAYHGLCRVIIEALSIDTRAEIAIIATAAVAAFAAAQLVRESFTAGVVRVVGGLNALVVAIWVTGFVCSTMGV